MAVYQRIFAAPNIANTHRLFLRVMREAREADAALIRAGLAPRSLATRAEVAAAHDLFNLELRALAVETARNADRRMKAILSSKQVRDDTGLSPHLRTLIRSRPINVGGHGIETGTVGIADEAWLNKSINPTSPQYGPYWRAQEYGTGGGEVASQLGRVIHGYFYGTGLSDPTPPMSQYQGGAGPHPIFVSGRAGGLPGKLKGGIGPRGGRGGRGVIRKEIEGKHFIRDGANQALTEWRLGMRRIEDSTISRLQAVLSPRTPGRRLTQKRRTRRR